MKDMTARMHLHILISIGRIYLTVGFIHSAVEYPLFDITKLKYLIQFYLFEQLSKSNICVYFEIGQVVKSSGRNLLKINCLIMFGHLVQRERTVYIILVQTHLLNIFLNHF